MADIDFTPESGDISFRPESGNPSGFPGNPGNREFGSTGNVGGDFGSTGQMGSSSTTGDIGRRVSETVRSGKSGVAGGLNTMGDRLESVADDLSRRGGIASRAGSVARDASHALDSGADYVRSTSLTDMRDDLSDQIRNHPLLSMGVAIGAGYLLSKLLD